MRAVFLILSAAGLFACGAQATSICASPAELKALQAAVLEQQLAAAAHSCHATKDYADFVAAYRNPIVRYDQTVRAFFRHRSTGESYDAYKSRIAHVIALKSLHDPKFCDTAKVVFDLALGRGQSVGPPKLLETGYEDCRSRPAKPMLASRRRPSLATTAKIESEVASAPAWNVDQVLAVLHPVNVPVPTPTPSPVRPNTHMVEMQPRTLAARDVAWSATGLPSVPQMRDRHPEVRHPAERYAAEVRPQWHNDDTVSETAGNVPNAYRPGATWVGAEVEGMSRNRWREEPPYTYRGPDGRWYVRISHRDRWGDDE